jgi:nickel transport protein
MNKYILKNVFREFFFFLMVLFCITNTAYAHKVMIFAWVEGDKVFTESKFSRGKKVKGGEILVYDLKGKNILEGKTDDKGEFSFAVPEKTTLKIVLQAGMGHRAEWTVPVDEIEDLADKKPWKSTLKSQEEEKPPKEVSIKSAEKRQEKVTRTELSPGLNSNEIEQAVEKALDKKLKPVIKMLNESLDRGPNVSEILGGIGYILGLMGVGAYFHYRRKKE